VTILYLVRHGQSDWNAANRFQGHVDRPLTDLGRAQAEALARELAATALEGIYSSPLRRALETAMAVAGGRVVPPEVLWHAAADMTPLAYEPPIALIALLLIAPLALLAANLLAAWPARRAARLHAGQILRTE